MENRKKFWLVIGIFVLILNSVGFWVVKSDSLSDELPQVTSFTVENVQIKLVNKSHYKKELVDQITKSIRQSVKVIAKSTDGVPTMPQEVVIRLAKSHSQSQVNLPAYATTTIYDPDQLYLENWNFYEMMLHALFNEEKQISPMQTIGLGEYYLSAHSEVPSYSPHEFWIIHRRYNKPSSLEELLDEKVFSRRIVKKVQIEGTNAYLETAYWKLASFSNFLIEKYGVKKFLPLLTSTDLKNDIEKTYAKSLAELEEEWNKKTAVIESNFPKKYNTDLEEDYQYWYGN